ncbi:MAG: cysteine dioxygenase family protein [Spirochaetota bacterium]|nr:cysteine dioxygenase family protein [Spirochaetota bacterium]
MTASSLELLEINSFSKECSECLTDVSDDEICVELIRERFPDLLKNKQIIADILENIVDGKEYPDTRSSTMFDNELLLYADPSRLFSLRLFLWGPGEYTVIHDHNSWGVIGSVSGELEVFNYRREDDSSKEGYALISETKKLTCQPGETYYTLRLNDGIHKIGNPTKDTMISLAIYGNPINRGYINGYDIANNRVYRIFAPKSKKKRLAGEALPGLRE